MNIIELAKQAGFVEYELDDGTTEAFDKRYAKFAALIAAQEREECAKLAETTVCDIHLPTGTKIYGSRVAAAIRERGTT